MPKMTTDYPEQINFLAPRGVTSQLRAISYYRGERGRYADPARDFVSAGIIAFIAALPPKERRRFDDILATVRITEELKD